MELLGARLARLLDCPREEVTAARAEATTDWRAWTRRLFDDAEVEGMVMDPGWIDGRSVLPYADLAGRPVWELQRLDPAIDAAIADGAGAADVIGVVDTLMADAAGRGVVGFKTAMAYRTGLDVDPSATLADADRSLRETETPVRQRGKAMRDLAVRRALGHCTDLRLPMQVHTGFGDGDIRPRGADPLLLDPLLRSAEGRGAPIVLIHGGWPWHDAVGYLAAVHRNVWAELSLVELFAPATTAERMLRLVEAAPTSRVMFGSDGHGTAESIWFGCVQLRDAWVTVADRLCRLGAGKDWLSGVRQAVFGGNARALYRLGRPEAGR